MSRYDAQMADKLYTGDTFPDLELTLTDGSPLSLPGHIETGRLLVVFYRGHW